MSNSISDTLDEMRAQCAAAFGLTPEQLGSAQATYANTSAEVAARIEERLEARRKMLEDLSAELAPMVSWPRRVTFHPEFLRKLLASWKKQQPWLRRLRATNKARRTQHCRSRR